MAASGGYGGGGETSVNGVSNNNRRENVGWGLSLGLPINRAMGVKLAYIGTRTQNSTGFDSDTFLCAFAVSW